MNLLKEVFNNFNNVFSKALKENNIIINNIVYKLPSEQNSLSSVLNHLDMVKKGKKSFIKLYNEKNEMVKLGTSFINNSEIKINIF